ncbi:putative RNA-directed DNA polymerase from transposon BS [Trichonephila clavipes]|nr:putative RNA-directed DNA polymerase from transposon BS [Trichonephila clavipes]
MFLAGVEKLITENSSIGLFADDIVLWHSSHDIPSIEANLSQCISRVNDFASNHKLSFNLTKSVTSFFTTNRHLYKYQPTVFIRDQKLLYVKHPKYLSFTLDQKILCNWHIEDLINKSRKCLNILKYISRHDWGADASTLKITYTTLNRPVLEFGSAIFFIASDSNLKKLERIQLSSARIIAGLRNSCPNKLVLYGCDLQPLNMRRNYCLTKYCNKLLSYCDQHRTSQYLKHWKDNQMLKRNSPFSQALAQNLSVNVEHHCLTSFIKPILGLQGVKFHYNLMPNVNKMSDHPELFKQLALEVIDGIALDAAKIYTDGCKGETNTTGSGV